MEYVICSGGESYDRIAWLRSYMSGELRLSQKPSRSENLSVRNEARIRTVASALDPDSNGPGRLSRAEREKHLRRLEDSLRPKIRPQEKPVETIDERHRSLDSETVRRLTTERDALANFAWRIPYGVDGTKLEIESRIREIDRELSDIGA